MRRLLLTATALAAFPAHAWAQQIGADAPAEVEAVVVTAARTETPLAETPAAITVIDRAELERRQVVIVSDELARTPGVSINRNGGPGTVTSVRIRGAEADQTVVLVDGVKLNDPASVGGGFDFANLLVGDVERIEVLRGPQSVLYGSQAIGGVINVLTADADSGSRLTAEVQTPTGGYLRGGTTLSLGRASLRLGAGAYGTEGVSAFAEERGGRENDPYEQIHVTGRLDAPLTDALALDLRAYAASSRSEFDGFPAPDFALADTPEYGEVDERVGYAGLTYDAGRLDNRLGLAVTEVDRRTFDPTGAGATTFEGEGRNERLEYQGVLTLTEAARLTFGAETERSRLLTRSLFSGELKRDVRTHSLYGQGSLRPAEGLTLTAGVRRDDHETFGEAVTAQAGAVWALGPTTLRANYGEGFKAPSLFQLYSDFGNEGLDPEEARSIDLGLEHRFGPRLIASATVFARRTENQIDFFSCFGRQAPLCAIRPFGFYENIRETEAHGLELAAEARPVERLSLSLAYTRLATENRSADDADRGRELARRPDQSLYVSADYVVPGGASFGAGVQHVGESFDDAANRVRLDAYTLVDLRGAAPVREGVEVFARVENLFDEDYETAAGYGSLGRSAALGLRLRF